MRIFACGISHESHSFSSLLTTVDDFQGAVAGSIAGEPGLIHTRSTEGGILTAAAERGWDLHFPFFAHATPSGPLTAETFEVLSGRLIAELRASMPVNGVLLALHGAMFAESYADCEGEILDRVRAVVGPQVPVAVSLDCHANVTDRMAELANVMTSFRTTPHVDHWETSYRAACLLDDAVHGRTQPRVHVARLPMLAGMDMGRTLDPDGPMRQLLGMARRIEAEDSGVLDIALNPGFYYGDVEEAGPSVTVTGDGGDPRYAAIADRLMREAWKTREYVSIEHVPVADAVEHARVAPRGTGPLILVDYTDGPAGGAHGDGTRLLAALLVANLPDTVVGPIHDPDAARKALAAGEGATLRIAIGGKGDPHYGGHPVDVDARVTRLSDGSYVRKGPFSTGTTGRFGHCALLDVGNVGIIVVSNRLQPEDREQYRLFGLDPESTNIIAMKGINHFRADFEPIARELVFVDSGGLIAVDFSIFPFKRVRRPIWPLDPDVRLQD